MLAEDRALTPPLIDTHVHFYTRAQSRSGGWPYPSDPKTYGDFLPNAYLKEFRREELLGVVAVATRSDPAYVAWLAKQMTTSDLLIGFIAAIPLQQRPPRLADLADLLSRDECLGLRITQTHLVTLQRDQVLFEIIEVLTKKRKILELYGSKGLLRLVCELAEQHPELLILVDHCGGYLPGPSKAWPNWITELKTAASHAKVYCKLSAISELQAATIESETGSTSMIDQAIDEILSHFSVRNLIYGSNWPVSLKHGSLTDNLSFLRNKMSGMDRAEINMVFSENAAELMRLEDLKSGDQ